jgi:hypothetical protein
VRDKSVKGHFVRRWHDQNGEHTEFFLENAHPQEVKEMLKYEDPSSFFPTATMRNRKVTPHGQEGDENPMGRYMGGVPLMHTRITDDPHGDRYDVRGEFSGFIRGHAPVHIEGVPGGTRVVETGTRARPDFTKVPVLGAAQQTFENTVPVMGPVARAMRETGEAMLGTVFENIHGLMASRNADEIAKTINRRRRR